MPQTKILVDTCSYFRLAQNIHPLLAEIFGSAGYTLYAHAALTVEFSRDARLRSKFDWMMQKQYVENRSRPLQLGRKEKKAIDATFEYMWEQVKVERLGPSPVDIRILATALELNLRVVTDDVALKNLAEVYMVQALTSLELMHLMLEAGRINTEMIHRVGSQWAYDKDLPANFRTDYRRLFLEEPPQD